MAAHHPQRRPGFGEKFGGALGAILMADAMESIAPYAVLEPFVWTGVDDRFRRQRAVESSIEDCYLRDLPNQLRDNLHALQFSSIVQRSKGRSLGNLRFHFRRD